MSDYENHMETEEEMAAIYPDEDMWKAKYFALLAERDALREALEIIAGKRQCSDNLMSNLDVALAALAQGEEGKWK